MKKFLILILLLLIGNIDTSFAQEDFNTRGIIIIDTIYFKGAIHLFRNDTRAVIVSDTSISYANDPTSCLFNGGAVYIPSTYFNLILCSNNKNKKKINTTSKEIVFEDQISPNKYIFNEKIILGIISSDDFDGRLMDYFPLNLRSNIPIWVFTVAD